MHPRAAELWRRLAPFLAATVLAFILVPLTGPVHAVPYALALALTGLVILMSLRLPWGRLPSAAQVVPPLVFLVSVALLRDAGGGNASGIGILALLPVFWVALHGTRRQFGVLLAGLTACFVVPIAFVGGLLYPATGYRTGILFLVVASIVGFTVHRLVAQVRNDAGELERHLGDLKRVAAISRTIATSSDARLAVCTAACEISGAKFAILLEPQGQDRLVSTAMAGVTAEPYSTAPSADRSGAAAAFRTRQSIFISDPANHDVVNTELWAEHGRPNSMLFELVLRGGVAAGVLVVGWSEPVADRRRTAIITLLAREAAAVIDRADLVERLNDLALTDPLTGALNRRAWDEHLAQLMRQAAADGRPLCVAMLDLDHFKAFNDTRGHQSGDRLLKEAVSAWRAVMRPDDMLARYGGEEFAVLLPVCTESAALPALERLRDSTPGGQKCSAGVAEWDGSESADALLARADAALYAAKAAGRDRTMAASLTSA
jgi:diguanylate cyclase (GGDEF)-like protein